MNFTSIVKAADAGFVRLRTKAGAIVAGREWAPPEEKSVIEVHGWVRILMRERGKIVPGSHREGHNIWTDTGREYLAQLMSIATLPNTAFRNDRVAYIGVGTGAQPEDPGVIKVIQPVAYATGLFLAALDVPPTFPLSPSRTTTRFRRLFAENEITINPGSTVQVSEIALYTNGSPSAVPAYDPGTRDRTIGNAGLQAPVSYKTFEPLGKTDGLEMEVAWEIRL